MEKNFRGPRGVGRIIRANSKIAKKESIPGGGEGGRATDL